MPTSAQTTIIVRREPAGTEDLGANHVPEGLRGDDVQRRTVTVAGVHIRVEFRPDVRCRLELFEGWWLYVSTPVGCEFYVELCELLAQAPNLGRERTIARLEHLRLTAFVACDEHTGNLSFGRSFDGLCSLYFGGYDRKLVISDSSIVVARRYGAIRLSEDDERAWSQHLRLAPERSFFEDTMRCFAGVRYSNAPNHSANSVQRAFMAPSADLVTPSQALTLFHEDLMRMFSGYRDKRIVLRLSGGLDSRTLLVGLMQAVREGILRAEQIACVSVLFPGLDCDESDIVRQVVALSGFEWRGVNATPERARWAYEHCLKLAAPPFPTGFMRVLNLQQARDLGADTVISGHGGDELFQYGMSDLLGAPLQTRLRNLEKLRKLRRQPGIVGASKALIGTFLGQRADFRTHKLLKNHGLASHYEKVHRLGRRALLASGWGYEVATHDAAGFGLLVDAPLLRTQLWKRYAPEIDSHPSGSNSKALARKFIELYSPEAGRLRSAKVAFDKAVDLQLAPAEGLMVSVAEVRARFQAHSYRVWASQFKLRDN